MKYLFLIARRLLFKRRSSLVTASFAVAAMIFLITFNDVVFEGIFKAVERDLTDFQYGNIVIRNKLEQFLDRTDSSILKQVSRNPSVEAAAPRIQVLANEVKYRVQGRSISVYQVPVVGIDPRYESGVTSILSSVVTGKSVIHKNNVLIGKSLAEELFLDGIKRQIEITFKTRDLDLTKAVQVSGIISSPVTGGLNDFLVVNIELLRDIYQAEGVSTAIILKVDQVDNSRAVISWIKKYYPDYEVLTAREAAGWLTQATATTSFINLVGYAGMIASALAVITVLTMIVSGKTRDIGVLRSLGISRREIILIFIFDGMLIGMVGSAIGALISGSVIFFLDRFPVAFFGGIVLEVKFGLTPGFLTPIMVGFVISVLASIYPAWRASKYEPAEAVKYV